MRSWLLGLFSTDGFVPRKECGAWTDSLIWLHAGSDVLIWLAYTAIPLTLIFLVRGRTVPFRGIFVLFAAFILACGTTHLLDAVIFEHPVYRLSGYVKLVTAIVSWVTVIALVPLLPAALRLGDALADMARSLPPEPQAETRRDRRRHFLAAVLFAGMAVLGRAILDPVLQTDHAFVLPLLGVVGAAWFGGFWPGLVALFLSMAGVVYFFVLPRQAPGASVVGDQFAVGLFLFAGVGCSLLGEAQRQARRKAEGGLAELHAANRALAESRDEMRGTLGQLQAVLANAPVGIAFLDPALNTVRTNSRFSALRKSSDPDLTSFAEFVLGREAELEEALAGVVRSGVPMTRRQFPHRDRLWEVQGHPVAGPEGGCEGVVVTAEDVTERRQAEGAMRRQLELTRAITDNATTAIVVMDADNRVTFFNPAAERMLGHSWAEAEGKPFHELVHHSHPDARPFPAADCPLVRAAALGEGLRNSETVFFRKGSEPFPVVVNAQVIREGDRAVGVVVEVRDVTEERRAAEALRASEERYRTLAEVSPQSVWTADAAGAFTYCNQHWHETTGLAAAQTLGDGWLAAVRPADRGRVRAEWAAAVRRGDHFDCEIPLRRASDGQYRWHWARGIPMRDDAGRVLRWVGVAVDVHDRMAAEEQARAAEEQARTLVDSIPQLAWTAEKDGAIFNYNRRWYEYTGTTPEQMFEESGWGWKSVHDPKQVNLVAAYFKECVEAGEEWEDTFPLRRHDGQFRWHLSRAVPVRNAAGEIVRWFGTNTDITEQRELEQRLREGEAKFRQLAENVPMAVWTARAAGQFDYVNNYWHDYTGTSPDQTAGAGWTASIHPDDVSAVLAAWDGAAGGGFAAEFRLRGRDGGYRWFVARGVPQSDDAGRVVRWVGTAADIHDQKEAAARLEEQVEARTTELKQQQNFLDAILDNVADGIVACDGAGTLKLFNASAKEFHGLPAEPLPPEQWAGRFDLYEGDGETPLATERIPLLRALKGERVRDAEMVIRPRDLPERYLLASGQPLTDAAGRNLGAVVSMRDMTERRAAQQKLERFALELQRSNAELEKFAYVASHDLQEPLRKIQAFGDRLGKKYIEALGDQGRDYLERMLSSAGRMRTLIDDLLAFSRVTTKGQVFTTVDLNAVAREVLADLEVRAAQAGADVQVGPLPTLFADRMQMRQLIQNLLGNALKFHAPGRPPVIALRAEPLEEVPEDTDPPPPTGGGWRISVEDNGIGFDQGYTDRIFEVFQRLHGREQYEGTGIGLAICRKIVERHGGAITARSRPGEGARFVADFPAPPDRPAGTGGES